MKADITGLFPMGSFNYCPYKLSQQPSRYNALFIGHFLCFGRYVGRLFLITFSTKTLRVWSKNRKVCNTKHGVIPTARATRLVTSICDWFFSTKVNLTVNNILFFLYTFCHVHEIKYLREETLKSSVVALWMFAVWHYVMASSDFDSSDSDADTVPLSIYCSTLLHRNAKLADKLNTWSSITNADLAV